MQDVQTTLLVGTILQGRYLVQGLLGSGPYGAVYVVKDQYVKPDLFNLLVLKEVVNPSKHKLHQIVVEAMALRLLHHQALPRVYQVIGGGDHDRIYLLMDYIEGPGLERLRVQQPERRFSFPQAMTLMAPIMEAVAYLHRQQPPVIHQNIKPTNILVPATSDKTVLVNFGVGKRYNPNATTTTAKATPRQLMTGYEAPEQASQAAINRSDIYALGATFYTLLTGFVPLNGPSRTIQMESMGKDPLEAINRVRPTISLDVAESIHCALSLNSEDRFDSVEQFAEALRVDPTWKLSAVEKREFDQALKAASKEHPVPEPIPGSSSSLGPEQEEGRRPTEPEAKSEEIRFASGPVVKQDEVSPPPVPVTKWEEIRPAPEPVKLQPGANPAASSIESESMAKQLEGERLPEAEPVVREEEPKPVPKTVVRQEEGRFEPVTEPKEREEEIRPAPEPVTSESATGPAASNSEHESEVSQLEGEGVPAAEPAVREEEPKLVPETLVRQAEGRFEPVTESVEREEEIRPAPEPVVREEASRHTPESTTSEPVENAVASKPEPGIEPPAVQEDVLPVPEPQVVQEDVRTVPVPRSRQLQSISFLQRRSLVAVLLLLVAGISLGTVLLTSALRPLARGSVSPTPSVVQKNTPSFHHPTPGSTRPTPGPTIHLAQSYEGTIFNLAANVRSNIFLRGIQQQQNTVSGSFNGPGINAPIHGSLDASGHIQFKVFSPSGSALFAFDGSMQAGGTFGGNYCQLDQHGQCSGEYGLWSLSAA